MYSCSPGLGKIENADTFLVSLPSFYIATPLRESDNPLITFKTVEKIFNPHMLGGQIVLGEHLWPNSLVK